MMLLNILYFAGVLYVLYSSVYYLFFTCIFFAKKKDITKSAARNLRFLLFVPAHNEEKIIERLITSIKCLEYSKNLYDVYVICDNCSDRTEQIVKENGLNTLVRVDEKFKGKGYALDWALRQVNTSQYDVILMTDADTVLKSDLLNNLSVEFADSNIKAVQCYNGVLNSDQTPLTRLMTLARALEIMNMAGRSFAGLTVRLIGNGMCFRPEILRKYPWSAFSISEDLEYFSILSVAGVRVHYSFWSQVYLSEERNFADSTTQRQRWSSGRFPLAVKFVPKIFWNGVKKIDFQRTEAVNIFIVPNPSLLANLVLFLCVIPIFVSIWSTAVLLVASSLIILGLVFFSSLFFVKNFKKNILTLAIAPIYLVWKGLIDVRAIFGKNRKRWVKTERR